MRIGELAKRSGVSRDTIRFYERQGLVSSRPEAGGGNSYRDYPEETLTSLDWIREAQAAGLSLSDLNKLLDDLGSAAGEDFDGIDFLDRKIAEIEGRIERSQRFLLTLREARAALYFAAG